MQSMPSVFCTVPFDPFPVKNHHQTLTASPSSGLTLKNHNTCNVCDQKNSGHQSSFTANEAVAQEQRGNFPLFYLYHNAQQPCVTIWGGGACSVWSGNGGNQNHL